MASDEAPAQRRCGPSEAGELADGVFINMLGPAEVPLLLAELHAGARAAGCDPEGLHVGLRLPLLVCDDVEDARRAARSHLGPYVAAPGYNRFFRAIGFEEEAEAVAAAYAARDRDAVAAAISDRLADALMAGGPVSQVRERIEAYGAAGVHSLAIWPFARDLSDAHAMLEAFAPATPR